MVAVRLDACAAALLASGVLGYWIGVRSSRRPAVSKSQAAAQCSTQLTLCDLPIDALQAILAYCDAKALGRLNGCAHALRKHTENATDAIIRAHGIPHTLCPRMHSKPFRLAWLELALVQSRRLADPQSDGAGQVIFAGELLLCTQPSVGDLHKLRGNDDEACFNLAACVAAAEGGTLQARHNVLCVCADALTRSTVACPHAMELLEMILAEASRDDRVPATRAALLAVIHAQKARDQQMIATTHERAVFYRLQVAYARCLLAALFEPPGGGRAADPTAAPPPLGFASALPAEDGDYETRLHVLGESLVNVMFMFCSDQTLYELRWMYAHTSTSVIVPVLRHLHRRGAPQSMAVPWRRSAERLFDVLSDATSEVTPFLEALCDACDSCPVLHRVPEPTPQRRELLELRTSLASTILLCLRLPNDADERLTRLVLGAGGEKALQELPWIGGSRPALEPAHRPGDRPGACRTSVCRTSARCRCSPELRASLLACADTLLHGPGMEAAAREGTTLRDGTTIMPGDSVQCHTQLISWLQIRGDLCAARGQRRGAVRLHRLAIAHAWATALAQYPVTSTSDHFRLDKMVYQAMLLLRSLRDELFGAEWAVRVVQAAARRCTPRGLRCGMSCRRMLAVSDNCAKEVAIRRERAVTAAWSAHFSAIEWAGALE